MSRDKQTRSPDTWLKALVTDPTPRCFSRDLDPFDFTVLFWGVLNYSGSQVPRLRS